MSTECMDKGKQSDRVHRINVLAEVSLEALSELVNVEKRLLPS